MPAAAALNWVLKDGLGRLGKLTVSTRFGRTFDSDLKRSRFTSSVVPPRSTVRTSPDERCERFGANRR